MGLGLSSLGAAALGLSISEETELECKPMLHDLPTSRQAGTMIASASRTPRPLDPTLLCKLSSDLKLPTRYRVQTT